MADDGEMEQLQLIEQELNNAVSDVMGRHGMVVTKWMAAVEVIDGSGERALEAFTSPGLRSWDSIGILGFLDARERGPVHAAAADQYLGDDEDGDG